MEGKLIKDVSLVVIDTETTGLSPFSYILEIGAVKLSGDRIIDTFSTLIRPPIPIPKDVTKIHGINDHMVKDAPLFPFVIDKFTDFIKNSILIAHNAPFDLKILTVNIKRAGRKLPDNPVLDTCKISRVLFPDLPSHSLQYLVKYWRSPFKELHRALSDAKHTAYIFLSILRKCGFTMEEPVEKLLNTFGPPLFFKNFESIYSTFNEDHKDIITLLTRCMEKGKEIEIVYETENKMHLKRRVLPLNLYIKHEKFYLKAFCLIDSREKSFRVDRIKKVRIETDENEGRVRNTGYFR